MKLFRLINLITLGTMLTACAASTPSAVNSISLNSDPATPWQVADAARQECHDRLDTGEYGSNVEMVTKCLNPKIMTAYEQADYPDLDLIMQIGAKRLELAEKVDAHAMTTGQASVILAKFATKMTDITRHRHQVMQPAAFPGRCNDSGADRRERLFGAVG